MTRSSSFDVIVAGVGAMGAAAADHLARRGLRVLALERHAIGHAFGSSHGLTRIIRLAYFEHPSYVPLLRRAFELWRALEADTGERLLHVTGGLDAGAAESPIVQGSLASCRAHDLPHEVLDAHAIHLRFPAWRAPEWLTAVHQPDAGFLMAERAVVAHARRAQAAGADIRTWESVLEWTATGGGARVRTDRGSYDAGQLVLAAGAWMGQIVPVLAPHLVPERQVLGWFEISEPAHFAPASFPIFVLDAPEGVFYGFPEFAVPGFKIGKYHHRREHVDPDGVDRTPRAADEAVLRQAVTRYFPEADGRLLQSTVCLFTNTADEHFIIDRHPEASHVLLVSPCSGHGFKFSSVIGEIVADLVERDQTRHDISLFRLARLGLTVRRRRISRGGAEAALAPGAADSPDEGPPGGN